MEPRPDSDGRFDRVLLLLVFALFLLLSPLKQWWAADDSGWFLPYILWLGVIVLAFLVQRRRDRHEL